MTSPLDRWSRFWADKRDPLHRTSDASHYDSYGRELSVLLDGRPKSRVVELGCGTGTFYARLGFDECERYVGVDLSEAMLDAFRQAWPEVEVEVGTAHRFEPGGAWDLVFSNGVIQYFDHVMLREQLATARRLLAPGGAVVHASVPWARSRTDVLAGRLPWRPEHAGRGKLARAVRMVRGVTRRLRTDEYGMWFDLEDLTAVGAAEGFSVSFFGSMHYLYRFHAVFEPVGAR